MGRTSIANASCCLTATNSQQSLPVLKGGDLTVLGFPGRKDPNKIVKGVSTLNKKLEAMMTAQSRGARGRFGKNVSVVVGFTAPYAVYQHEILWYNHPRGGQAKFLEQPANEMRPVLASTVSTLMSRGAPASLALLTAGFMLLQRATALAPIKTGALRKSGFVRLL